MDESGEVVILMRNKKDSKIPLLYKDFGSTIKECDPNIFYTAARSYIVKSFGMFLPSELESLNSSSEIEKKIKEFNFKNEIEVFSN